MMRGVKTKDLVYIGLTVIIVMAVAVLGYRQLRPQTNDGVSVEVVQPVSDSFNSAEIARLRDDKQARDFTVPIDLKTGLGNNAPFGQL